MFLVRLSKKTLLVFDQISAERQVNFHGNSEVRTLLHSSCAWAPPFELSMFFPFGVWSITFVLEKHNRIMAVAILSEQIMLCIRQQQGNIVDGQA
jgi:hypothetical protein